jgi:Protein of unknown function (DUF3363)
VSRALERRKDSIVDQGMAMRTPEGGVSAPRDLLSRLEQQEIARVGPEMATARGLTFKPAETGNYVSGRLVGSVSFASGKFAMIDDGLGFSLVPWHPVLEKQLERHISGIAMPDGGIDWTFGRSRGLSLRLRCVHSGLYGARRRRRSRGRFVAHGPTAAAFTVVSPE